MSFNAFASEEEFGANQSKFQRLYDSYVNFIFEQSFDVSVGKAFGNELQLRKLTKEQKGLKILLLEILLALALIWKKTA